MSLITGVQYDDILHKTREASADFPGSDFSCCEMKTMDLPSGTITFLFTDIEGSTRLWEQQPELMQAAVSRHDAMLRQTVEQYNGVVFKTTGDGLNAVFRSAPDAVRAALAGQRALCDETWAAAIGELRARMAVYTGTAEIRDGDYFGPVLNRVSRLLAAGHGGQTLLSQATQELVRDDLPEQAILVDLGEHWLRDVARPEHLYQATAIDLPSEFPPLRSFDAQRTNLPSQPTPFVGREEELAAVVKLLRRDGVRLVTLTGPGGMGKTRLAVQTATQLLGEFEDGVFFVDLSPTKDTDLVPSAIATALGLRPAGTQMLVHFLKQHLSTKHLLLVLDNFEHLLDAAGLVPELLDSAPSLSILATSREALNLHEEWLFPLSGLSFPVRSSVDEEPSVSLETYDAVQLFVESAKRVRPSFSLMDDKTSVIRICQLVEGMPLAIELAASWTKTLRPETVADEIERGLDILATKLRNVPRRHRSMRAVFDYSWRQLAHDEQVVFRRLSVFRGGFQRVAAEQVTGASLDILTALVDKSLLRWEPGPDQSLFQGRYYIHELLRQYAREQLKKSPEGPDRVLDLHSDYYADFLHQRDADISGRRQHKAVREISADFDNVRAAWQRAVEQGNISNIGKSIYAFTNYCDIQGHFQEITEAIESAIERVAVETSTMQRELILASLLSHLGYNAIRVGQFEQARTAFEHSRSIYQDLGVPPPMGMATDPLAGLALLAMTQGEYAEAAALGDEALWQHEQRSDKHNLQVALYVLSDAATAMGRYEEARNYAQRAYALTQETNNRWMMAYVLSLMGNVYRGLGDYELAHQHYQSSYAMKREFNDPEGMAVALIHMAKVAWLQQEYAEAEKLYQRSLAIYEQIDDPGGLALSLLGLGDTALFLGDFQRSGDYLRQAMEIAAEMEWAPTILALITSAGDLMLRTGYSSRGVELLSLVMENPASDQETKKRAEGGLAQIQADLAPEVFEDARKRGETLDLELAPISLMAELAALDVKPGSASVD